jgi:transcription elongation GreA/GreB family factor
MGWRRGTRLRHEPGLHQGNGRHSAAAGPTGKQSSELRDRARTRAYEAEVERFRHTLAEAQASSDRDKIASAGRELRYWTARRTTAEVQPPPSDCRGVQFGCRVTIERDDGRRQTFRIVGEDEADPAAETLSYVSPLACALIGKEVGDVVSIGQGQAEILAIKP